MMLLPYEAILARIENLARIVSPEQQPAVHWIYRDVEALIGQLLLDHAAAQDLQRQLDAARKVGP